MKKTCRGSCHCQSVRFEAAFDLAAGTFRLRDYQLGKKRIHHFFCTQCGVRPFSRGVDQKGGENYAIPLNCLDAVDPKEFAEAPVRYFNMLHDDFKSPAETRHL